MSARNFKRN